ncbi:hypothetical protein [Amycolatopsis keratiniphila]|uniref:Uncharacterized protein n=1 Tax=Amycolatopsis keratiniphila subsp. keratiniphila TaxID=227715 RepID=A0A1W2M015_9PSEU|nr:hypothetical protein [Amycolatopsis keratiniphila]ONF72957.1 hypothetical protein AVR91_0208260 [Amycolatopsis keratiniphila subsp. keratiniphila]
MISFTFLPRIEDPSWDADGLSGLSARTLTADDLTFHYFSSDVVIGDGCNEIQLRTPGLPVVDFVLMLVQLCREVVSSGASVVESSQTQDSITAVMEGGAVELSYSFSDVVSTIPLCDLKEAPNMALQSAFGVLFSAHDDLRFNEYLIELADLVRSD